MKHLFAIFIALAFSFTLSAQSYNDSALQAVTQKDVQSRDADGALRTLTIGEHLYRADVYMANRHFAEAREHWQKVLSAYPDDSNVPKALFGMGRSNMWELNYDQSIFWFDKLIRDHANTADGQEGLAYKGASFVRLGKNLEAAQTYEQYTVMFPYGKRIASSFLNIIDAYREAGEYDKANLWVDKARKRFDGMDVETDALHARLRMELYRKNWSAAIAAADELLRLRNFSGTMAYEDEVKYLKGFALEHSGRKNDAMSVYVSISLSPTSYYGIMATERIAELGGNVEYRRSAMRSQSQRVARSYPAPFRSELLRYSKTKGIDPRFVLAIMKQESSFRPGVKSPAAARGLLQLTIDTALKFNEDAGFYNVKADDLYRPNVNIAIGSAYIAELKNEFGGLYEAIAASYNGGESNAARWLARSNPKEAAIFASEVGFSETKKYVYKVMGNYRVYQELYTEDLIRK
ncbi:MAG: transglycosylase SLT domain-containing protein [Pyrinomonadaceae bacterium]